MRLLIAIFGLAAAFAAPQAFAKGGFFLGQVQLSQAENDVDKLNFASCRKDVRAVQLRVKRGNAEIEHFWLRFANGERVVLEVRDRISKGESSRWVDLPGGERCITDIGVVGDTENSRKRAFVQVYGR